MVTVYGAISNLGTSEIKTHDNPSYFSSNVSDLDARSKPCRWMQIFHVRELHKSCSDVAPISKSYNSQCCIQEERILSPYLPCLWSQAMSKGARGSLTDRPGPLLSNARVVYFTGNVHLRRVSGLRFSAFALKFQCLHFSPIYKIDFLANTLLQNTFHYFRQSGSLIDERESTRTNKPAHDFARYHLEICAIDSCMGRSAGGSRRFVFVGWLLQTVHHQLVTSVLGLLPIPEYLPLRGTVPG